MTRGEGVTFIVHLYLYFLFKGLSTAVGDFMPKPSIQKNCSDRYYLTYCWGNNRVPTFPKCISPKVNVIVQLEYELTYFKTAD